MTSRHRTRRHKRREAHATSAGRDRPHRILEGNDFPAVKRAHIVPRMYQAAFAADGKVAVHIDGAADPVVMPITHSGTRSYFYRRWRPDGTPTHDVEASLAAVESAAAKPLKDIVAGNVPGHEAKGVLASFFAVQMLRGPGFFAEREELLKPLLDDLSIDDLTPEGRRQAADDPDAFLGRLRDAYLGSTRSFMTMLTKANKMAAVLANMRWQLLRFEDPVLAYSDHPVWVWPGFEERAMPRGIQGLGPLGAFEVGVPLSGRLALLMNWVPRPDSGPVDSSIEWAGQLNAFTIAQCDRQWMHGVATRPPIAHGPFAPLTQRLYADYHQAGVLCSPRHRSATAFLTQVRGREHIRSFPLVEPR